MPDPLKILLIEPHDETAKAIARVLNGAGHYVTRAATLAEAADLCGMMRFELVVTERRLPDGEADALLSKGGACRDIPTLLVTNDDAPTDGQWAGVRFVEYLRKPVTAGALSAAIERASAAVG